MKNNIDKQINQILSTFQSLSNPESVEGMAKFGIKSEKNYGVSLPELRKMAKDIGKDHRLALKLWEIKSRETRILASMVDKPEDVTEEQMEEWVKEFDNWETCDQVCQNLFMYVKPAYKKSIEWSGREEEFVKRAAFVIMARFAVKNKKMENKEFEPFFPIIKREASDERNFVKKAVSWALRQIGKRNVYLNNKSIEIAEELLRSDSKSARWIAKDVLRELKSEKIRKRL